MTTKAASFLALAGMLLLTILVIAGLLRDNSGVFRDVVPMVRLVRSLLSTFLRLTTLRESRKRTQQLCEPPRFVRQTGWSWLSSLDHTGPEPPLFCNALKALGA